MKAFFLIFFSALLLRCSESKVTDDKTIVTAEKNEGVVIHPYESELMKGFSVTDSSTITLSNWDHGPFNRWSYQHFRELVPTQSISRGTRATNRLQRAAKVIDTIKFTDAKGRFITIRQMLDSSFTDGFIVLKNGKIVMEEYFTGMQPSSLHLLQSASKSLMVALLAIHLKEGKVRENASVAEYIPELKNSGYANANVASLMDMQSGVSYSYGQGPDDMNADLGRHMQSWGWKPRAADNKGHRHFLTTLKKEIEPGKVFNYKDSDTEVLAWIMEKINRKSFADLFSERIWSQIGAEYDAYISCDGFGSSVTSGGMNVSLRDFARIGQLYLDKGNLENKQLVPAEFFDDVLKTKDTAKFASSMFASGSPKGTAYNNKFWIPGGHEDAYLAFGYQGQYLYIHPKYNVVIAKFSTQPGYDMSIINSEWSSFYAIAKALGK